MVRSKAQDEMAQALREAAERQRLAAGLSPQRKTDKRLYWLFIIPLALIIWLVAAWVRSNNQSDQATQAIGAAVKTHTVLYEVDGTARSTNVVLQTLSGSTQLNDMAVPLHNASKGTTGVTYQMASGHAVYLSAQNAGGIGTITCRITVDGVVVAQNTSIGGYAIASCSGTVN